MQGRDPVCGWNRSEGNYDMVSYVMLKMVVTYNTRGLHVFAHVQFVTV